MTVQERMQERIDIFCDADRMSQMDQEVKEKHSPMLAEIVEVMGA